MMSPNRGESEIQIILKNLETNPDRGLSEVEAYNRLRKFGTNELKQQYTLFRYVRFASLFSLAVGIILVMEGALWYALGITVVGIILMLLSSTLKMRCRHSTIISEDQSTGICSGIRGGRLLQLPIYQLVPGDIVRIQAGDIVPADGRLIEAVNLLVKEKELSESVDQVSKDALQPSDSIIPSEVIRNKVFMNTLVMRGRGTFVVTETGRNTKVGKSKVVSGRQGRK